MSGTSPFSHHMRIRRVRVGRDRVKVRVRVRVTVVQRAKMDYTRYVIHD